MNRIWAIPVAVWSFGSIVFEPLFDYGMRWMGIISVIGVFGGYILGTFYDDSMLRDEG